jgi:hypothetical protein
MNSYWLGVFIGLIYIRIVPQKRLPDPRAMVILCIGVSIDLERRNILQQRDVKTPKSDFSRSWFILCSGRAALSY